jgi:hypothetical protein
MPIQYALFENNITSDPDDFSAHVQPTGVISNEQIVPQLVQLGSTVNEADGLAVLQDIRTTVMNNLLNGFNVHLADICVFSARIIGTFDGPTDGFDPARHSISIAVTADPAFVEEFRAQASPKKNDAVQPEPNPLEYRDLASATTNTTMTRGTIGSIAGSRLKFDASTADEGIWLVPTGAGVSVQVPDANIQRNKPAELIFLVPTAGLAIGTYFLEVRARIASGLTLRTGRLDSIITVV